MKKLPSLISTYQRVFTLYGQTINNVLPLALIVAVGHFFLMDMMSKMSMAKPAQLSHDTYVILGSSYVIYYLIYALVFCITLYGMNQKHQKLPFNYVQAFNKGGPRVIPMIFSGMIVCIPILISLLGIILLRLTLFRPAPVPRGSSHSLSDVAQNITATMNATASMLYIIDILTLVVGVVTLILILYFYVTSVLIVVKRKNAWQGLKQSWRLTKGHWWYTFFLVLILGLPIGLLNWGFKQSIGIYAGPIIQLFTFSLTAALMIIHCENLENAFDEPENKSLLI